MLGHLLTTFITLFVIIDPIGTVPVFIALTANQSAEKRLQIAKRAVLTAAGVLLFFTLLGQVLFDAIGVRLLSFEIGGGIVLFLFGLKMIFDKPEGAGMAPEPDHDIAIFPLAMPTIAGPGAMLGVVVAANNPSYNFSQQALTTAVLIAVLLCTYFMIRYAEYIHRYIGATGAIVLSRVLGIILTAIATETIIKGITKLL